MEYTKIHQYVNFHSSSYKQFDWAQVIETIVVYTTVSMLLIIKKVILFNIYCYRGMIIDAITSMEERALFLKGKIKDRLKKKLKIWSWKGTIKLKYRFDIQQLPSSLEEKNINKKFINHFRFYVKVLLCWEWNSIMFKEEIVSLQTIIFLRLVGGIN